MPNSSPKNHQYKVIFIDWNKTLSESLFWSQLANKNHHYNHYHEQIIEWLFIKNSDLIDPWMRGLFTAENICEKIATDLSLDSEIIFKNLKESCENMSLCSPEIARIITQLRNNGLKVVIATDNMDTFQRFTIAGMGLNKLFDEFLVSYELKTLKYDTHNNQIPFFDNFLNTNGLAYSDVVLLDDNEDKSEVYNKLGFKIDLIKDTNSLVKKLRWYAE